ncbi:hypothetical protein MAP00_005213 [Monascus purpureus]|nr:hypothetical protein MAP00_005213 [Monascus purpureus]
MGPPGLVTHLSEQYPHLRHPMVTGTFRRIYHLRPKTRRLKVLWITFVGFFLIYFLSRRGSFGSIGIQGESTPNYWAKYPSYFPLSNRPEDAVVISNLKPSTLNETTLPSNLQKTNPSFHVLIPATQKSPRLCRTVASAMILNYPPPTLLGYGRSPQKGSTQYDLLVDRINGTYKYLKSSQYVHDEDFVLIVGGSETFFQLPPEVLVRRFQTLLRENNEKLRKKYGFATVGTRLGQPSPIESVQKYMQRVLFGASKTCFPNLTDDVGCRSVPESTLPPDIYGWETDSKPSGKSHNRPRWLNPDVVIGQAGDLKLIYEQALRFVEQHRNLSGDYLALTQIYGRQEYVRELERRRTAHPFKEWLYRKIGISDASNITGVKLPLVPGRRYEYGIGLDFESRLFFNTRLSHNDAAWFEYRNVTKSSKAQADHGVPRERRLLLPPDLAAENIDNPFTQPRLIPDESINQPFDAALDALPSPRERGWPDVKLMTNVRSASIPALIHLNNGDPLDNWWSDMWFSPWTRALLRKAIRSSRDLAAAQSYLIGGQDSWDSRGGAGGVWTDSGEWISFADLISGFERDVFDDDRGGWGMEGGVAGGRQGPVYNQFGKLVKGTDEKN